MPKQNVKTRLRHDEFWELVEVKFADPGVVMATRGNAVMPWQDNDSAL